jgi:tRNA-specific 2-thiouridylase
MGQHNGFYYHTRGQRKGLGLSGGPWYVVSKDINKNIVYVSCNYDSLADSRSEFRIESGGNFVVEDWHQQANLQVKLRHGPTLYKCVVQANVNGFQVKIDGSDQGIAAGQFAVFYIDDLCLGSAKILEN